MTNPDLSMIEVTPLLAGESPAANLLRNWKDPDQVREYNRAYYAKNRERLLEEFKAWKAANRSAHRASAANWQQGNRAASRELKARWKKLNPEKAKAANRRNATSRAKHAARQRVRNKALATPTPDVLAFYVRAGSTEIIPCHWCAASTAKGARHVDHVTALSRGGRHALDNLVIACTRCNLTKKAQDPAVFAAKLKARVSI